MKTGIHPTFYEDAIIICGTCGTTWHTGATQKEIHVDVCSNCHPFYTGTQRIVDTAGQVERFTKRLQARESVAPAGAEVKPSKKERRRLERAKRSGMLEAMEPEPVPTPSAQPAEGASAAEGGLTEAAKAVGEAVGTAEAVIEEAGKTISGAVEAITSTVAPRPPRERRPRPPRERRPRAPREERGGASPAPQASAAPESAPAEASRAQAPSAPEASATSETGSSEAGPTA